MKKTIRWALATFLMFLLFHFNTFTTIPAINLNGIDAKLTTVLTQAKGCREQECCPAKNTTFGNHQQIPSTWWSEYDCEEQKAKNLISS